MANVFFISVKKKEKKPFANKLKKIINNAKTKKTSRDFQKFVIRPLTRGLIWKHGLRHALHGKISNFFVDILDHFQAKNIKP